VLKGKNIDFCSRDELFIVINLPHLGVCDHRELHNFILSNTFILQVNSERHGLLSFKVTGEVLELLGIGKTAKLRHGGQCTSLAIRVLANPQLGTEKSPVFVGHKCDYQLGFNNLNTDFSSLHGLHVTTSNNCVASRRNSGMQVSLRCSVADFGTGPVVDFAVTRDGEIEPSHPSPSIPDRVLIGECLDLGANEWLAIGSNLCHFDKGNHSKVFDSLTRGTETRLKVCRE
jgi:hypothetical protein